MADTNNNKVMAVLCYIWILWLIPLITEHKNEPFVRYHINQGIILTIAWVVLQFAAGILRLIPVLGSLVTWAVWIVLVVLMIIGILNAVNMEEKPLPIIGTLFTVYK
ncbi:MAG: DUF4870 domain-containing protein [Clostridia bacterium]|nr:DUF4870 domain-containing protein [Clostridia bacterium]